MNDVSNKSGAMVAPALIRLLLASVGMFLLILMGFSGAASAAGLFVVNTEIDAIDSRPGDGVCLNDGLGKCSLRAAIMESNDLDGSDTIHLPEGTYRLSLGGPQENSGATGDLDILGDLTIIGSGGNANGDPADTVIDGAGIDRVLTINPEATLDLHVEIKTVTITNGKSSYETLYSDSIGGGILGDAGNGSLVIYNSIISNNAADSTSPNYGVGGGAMLYGLTGGTIRIENSSIMNNSAHNYGGGLTISADSNVQIINSTISGNTAGQKYGGLSFAFLGEGTPQGASIENSTISRNTAEGNGGGIGLTDKTTLKNVTISGNTSKFNGGGLYIRSSSGNPVTMTNLTITDNLANSNGSGLYAMQGDIVMHNSIVAGNQSNDIGGSTPLQSTSSNNLVGTVSNGGLTHGVNGNLIGQSPKLGPLADNGGKTLTHALLNGSPAIDAGDNARASAAGITSDQRGAAREVDSADENPDPTTDIGAYEAHATISDIQDVTTSVNTAKSVAVNIGDGSFVDRITASSSNQTVIPNANIAVEGTGSSRTIKVTPAPGQVGKSTITVSVSDKVGGPDAVDTFEVNVVAAPDLTITKSHTGNFYKGQTGATYTIHVTNAGIDPTSGTVTVTDTLPTGLTATAINGAGWTCNSATLTCTRGDALAAGASYPDITITVNVAANAPTTVTNTASVSGGNDVNTGNNSASDITTIIDNPRIDSVTAPANGTYKAGDVLNFTIQYSRNVAVNPTNGTPFLPVTIGTESVQAPYAGGSGTNAISFSYTVKVGESDTDGIALGTALSLQGGTIKDEVTGNDAELALNGVPNTAGVKIDAVAPEVVSVAVPADKKYGAGQQLTFTVKFKEPVNVSGAPSIDLAVGSKTEQAAYFSGTGTDSLVFRYEVQAGDADEDGIVLGVLQLNGGSIQDNVGNDAVLTLNGVGSTDKVWIDTLAPSVQSVSVPSDGSYHTGEVLSFTVNFDDAITVGGMPSIPLSIGGVTKQANYQSGAGTNALLFQYIVQAGDTDTDGIEPGTAIDLNGASLRDGAGNDADLALTAMPSTSNVLVDSTEPTISTVDVPLNATYRVGQDMAFKVKFSENVFVETSVGTPGLQLVIGANTVQADYETGSGTNTLEFRYTVKAGDLDLDGIRVSSMALNGASIRDTAGNDASITLYNVAPTNGVLVDAAVPTVTSVSVPADKTYVTGESLDFIVAMSEIVDVDETQGAPSIELAVGATAKQAIYASGTGTNKLTFRYEVRAGDLDADGISLGNAISLNGSSIQDSNGNDAILTLNGVQSTAGVIVDAVAPRVNSVNVPASKTYQAGENLDLLLNFSETVTVTPSGEAPYVQLVIGNTTVEAPYLSGSGSSVLAFRYTVKDGDNDSDGIELKPVLQLNGAFIRDLVGNGASDALTGIGDTSNILIDTTPPGASGVTVPADGFYRQGDDLQISVKFSEAVTVAGGNPTISVTIGSASREAVYQSGSGSDTLIFSYTVQSTDHDEDGVVIGNAIALNGSTISDTAGHPAALSIHPGATPGVLVDNTPPATPTIDITDGVWFNKDEIEFEGTGDAGTTIEVIVDSSPRGTKTIGVDGRWKVKVSGLAEGSHTIKAISKDAAGNASESSLFNFSVDLTVPPKPTIALSETAWTNQNVTVTITGEPGTTIQYKLDQGAWTNYTGIVTISKEGETEVYARQSDTSQNISEDEKAVVRIDKTAPVITLKGAATMTVYKGAAYVDPGVTIVDQYASGLTPKVTGTVDTTTLGTYTLQYDAEDLAGNQANPVVRTVRVVNRPIDLPVTYPVTGVILDQEKLTLSPDDAPVTLHATVKPEYATNQAVVWSSSDPDVAQVDSSGRVTAKKAGKATITVSTVDGNKTASCEVTVKEENSLHLKASPSSFNLQPEESTRFRVYAIEGEKRIDITTDKDTSYSIDNDLVSVKRGQITAGKEAGESIITVSYRGEELTIPVTIEKEAFRLEVSETSFLLKPKGTARLKVYAIDGKKRRDITNDKGTSYSTDNDLVTVKQGRITAGKEEGESEITVSYEGEELTIPVIISKVSVKSLTASLKQAVLELDDERQLKVTASLSDGSRKDVTDQADWVTSDPDAVEVTDEGEIIARQAGTAVITVKYGGKRADSRILVVEEKKPRILMVNRSSLKLEASQTVSVAVNASYEKGYQEEITRDAEWSSQDPSIATAENGSITAVAEGRTTVTVSYGGKKVTIYVTVRK